MIIDLFGGHSRYARRNAGNALKSELEAVSGSKQAKGADGIPNLANLFSGPVAPPVRKPVAPPVSKSELPKCVVGRITQITRCEGGTCTKQKICE